jgi:hypothetical protein
LGAIRKVGAGGTAVYASTSSARANLDRKVEILQIPYPARLRVDESKLVGYLLSHAKGQGKAAFFLRFGFSPESWLEMAEALKHQARSNPLASKVDSLYGTRYSVDGMLSTPSGRQPSVRTVWILEIDSDEPRLITAHPI